MVIRYETDYITILSDNTDDHDRFPIRLGTSLNLATGLTVKISFKAEFRGHSMLFSTKDLSHGC